MRELTSLLERSDEFQQILKQVTSRGGTVAAEGVSGAGKSLLIAALRRRLDAPCLVITFNNEQATKFAGDLQAFTDDDPEQPQVLLFPATESVIYDGAAPDRELRARRMDTLNALLTGRARIVVAPINAALQRLAPPSAYEDLLLEVKAGDSLDLGILVEHLLANGYHRASLVEDVGEFSVRGGIVDVFLPTRSRPVRLELFGDEVESIREFETESQRSREHLERVTLCAAADVPLERRRVHNAVVVIRNVLGQELQRLRKNEKHAEAERLADKLEHDLDRLEALDWTASAEHYLPFLYEQPATIVDFLPENALVVADEPVRLRTHADQFEAEVREAYEARVRRGELLRLPQLACASLDELVEAFGDRPQLCLTMLAREVSWAPEATHVRLATPPVDSFGGQLDLLAEGIREWCRTGHYVVMATPETDRVAEMLDRAARGGRQGLKVEPLEGQEPKPGRAVLAAQALSSGFKLPSADLIVLSDAEVFGWHKLRRPKERKFRAGITLTSLSELAAGDHVVHINHGVGRYEGLVKQTVQGVERDYLLIKYAGEDRLYVPVAQIDRVQKYIGSDGPPTIHGLKSTQWQRTKRRVRRSARLLAKELLDLYAARERARGHAFGVDSPWLREMEASFPYEETPDQWQAVQDVKADMKKPLPADRLVCGDVGYGKTEVAIRAAFAAVLEGKQAAVLVPTTVLAQQHYHTFSERLANYPVNIQMLSRFKTRSEQQSIVAGLQQGTVDIVIGTHRLLQPDVKFKALGLVVVDEEQRFGVRHKEKLKQLRSSVDVINLTATPIPRTLHMSLSGIRDMSIINDPPAGRLPIKTYAREHDEEVVREAILREMERGGQVYYVHNRVQSINHVAARLQRLLPNARIAVGHGQQSEDQLEQVMLDFYAGSYDVLVCTTIIESGLDIPNVNTIIIENAHQLGLAQLYQLRGRVGRSNRQAYAYLMYRYPERLTPEAEQRLQAIEELCELGSGFKLALRDLEIRGAGDLLGPEQHGHMAAVGFELYCRMLEQAVRSLRGEHARVGPDIGLELPVEAVIPASYVGDESQRIALYRRIAAARSEEEVGALEEEAKDRYGELPGPVGNLLRIARLRVACGEVGVEGVIAQQRKIVVRLEKSGKLSPREARLLRGLYQRGPMKRLLPRAAFAPLQISFGYSPGNDEQIFAGLEEIIDRLRHREQEPAAERRDRRAVRALGRQ
ncbi:MAG: transcription-repair coupling factor [Armatimonadota bacterium]